MREPYWTGYIQDDYGLSLIEIYPPEDSWVAVYIRGELADDIITKDDLNAEANNRFYKTIADFVSNDWLSINEVWPK